MKNKSSYSEKYNPITFGQEGKKAFGNCVKINKNELIVKNKEKIGSQFQ